MRRPLPSHHWTLPGSGFQSLYTSGAQIFLHHSCDTERLCGRSLFRFSAEKKGLYFDVMTVSMQSVITSLSSGLSCLDASVYHTVHPLAALLVSQPSRPRLHIPTQSSRFTVSDCKEFLCSGSARSLSAEKSFLCHYQWLHPPAEESSYHAPYH